MCGITAIIRARGEGAADWVDARRMHDALRHRGPDAEGAITVDGAFAPRRHGALADPDSGGAYRLLAAVRRLRVTDPRREADQPLVSADGSACVLLNGAIYNHRELAAELGSSFATANDAEVVLQAYRTWGSACFSRLTGMWAILIVDFARRKVVGSRDRFGIKPLYFAIERDRMVFCSEPAPIAAVLEGGARPEPARLLEFLSGYPPRSSALTFYRGVHPVPAATWFEVDLQSDRAVAPDFVRYWDLADHHWDGCAAKLSFDDAAECYRHLLEASVAMQSVAEVKAGSLLSGGLDTSTIVALWSRAAAARGSPAPEAYSIAWNDPRMDESPYQRAVAAATGVHRYEWRLTPEEVWQAVDTVVAAQGQPLLGQELIAQHFAYRLAREHGAVVVLDGSGSDEVQAGLPPYEVEMVMERLERFELLDVARELHCIARNYGRSHASVLKQYLLRPLRRRLRGNAQVPRYAWLDPARGDGDAQALESSVAKDPGRDPSRLNRLLYRETRHTNVPAVLMYSDRNAMAHSVEARFPFLDHRLVEFCFSLPPGYKVGFGVRKKMLRAMASELLPPMVAGRREKRMFVRLTNWMPLRDRGAEIRATARSPAWRQVAGIDAQGVAEFVEAYLMGKHDDAYAVWRIHTAARWMEMRA